MSADDVKLAIAVLAVTFTAVNLFYTFRRNARGDSAGSLAAQLSGWDDQVKALVASNERCEESREKLTTELELLKKSTVQKISDLENEATRMRLESRRDMAAIYGENDALRNRVRELERGNGKP